MSKEIIILYILVCNNIYIKFRTNKDHLISGNTHARDIVNRYSDMSTLWTNALETFLKHLTHDNSVGSSYFFVDVHVSAGTSSNLESTSKSKLVQYNNAWNQFRHETLPSNPDKYRHFMTRYQQINHSRKG